jgi:hypothetical protein
MVHTQTDRQTDTYTCTHTQTQTQTETQTHRHTHTHTCTRRHTDEAGALQAELKPVMQSEAELGDAVAKVPRHRLQGQRRVAASRCDMKE